jgi:two-component system, OmpR family, sensor kinase
MTSLRHTALVWMTVLLAVVGAFAVVISYEVARSEAAGFLDGQLHQIALNIGRDPDDDFAIGLWNAAGDSLPTASNASALPRQPHSGFSTVKFGGEDWRVYTASDGRGTVQVAQRMSVRQKMAERQAIEAAAPILVVIPLAWLVVGWSTGRVLGRLTKLAQTIAERGTDSTEPIPIESTPMEASPLVAAMNVLIDRLQQALDLQRRFVADAAHQLRTPLSALHLQIENLSAAVKEGDLAFPASELEKGIRRTSALLEQLLKMARFDAPVEPGQQQRINLSDLVTECVAGHISIAARKGVDLGITAQEASEVSGAPAELKILFANLIDNAVRYTPTGGSVDVSVRRHGKAATVEVADTGCGVEESHLPLLFDRFFRAAPSDVEGSGLGLAIVEAIAKRHGLAVKLENRRDRPGLVARVSFPVEISKG